MNKKRIQIIVQPVDNGYTIQGNASDHPSGQNAKHVNLIAKTDGEVASAISGFVQNVFAEPEAPGPSVA